MGGETHILVGEGEIGAHLDQDHAGDRIELGGEPRLLLEPLGFAHRHIDGEIGLAGLNRGDARGGVLDDLDGDARDLRLRAPIAVVALQHDARVQFVFGELVRPGADGFFQKIIEAARLDIFLRHHVAAEERHPLRRGRRRRVEFHGRLGGRFDDDVVDLPPGIRGVEFQAGFDALEERVAKILRRHLVAVVEGDVVAQLDRHAQGVRRQAPALDQMRNEFQLRVLIERLIEHRLEDRLRVGREALIGIPGRHVVRPADRRRVGAGGDGARKRRRYTGCGPRGQLQERPTLQLERHGVLLKRPDAAASAAMGPADNGSLYPNFQPSHRHEERRVVACKGGAAEEIQRRRICLMRQYPSALC